tara:strand:+ start:957 stop:1238 length:282 start_codon:yes stop_codon:yes gene_type:complete
MAQVTQNLKETLPRSNSHGLEELESMPYAGMHRLEEVTEILQMRMVQITDRYSINANESESKQRYLSKPEVRRLIKALFMDSKNRAEQLAKLL